VALPFLDRQDVGLVFVVLNLVFAEQNLVVVAHHLDVAQDVVNQEFQMDYFRRVVDVALHHQMDYFQHVVVSVIALAQELLVVYFQ
jgi:hypothetical protein